MSSPENTAGILDAAQALVSATDNAERNAALGDLYNAMASEAADAAVEQMRPALERIARMPVAEGPGVRMREIARAALAAVGEPAQEAKT